jgi:sulfide:quinone oxidoreductase
VAFVVPPGSGWTLPLYELALLTARHVSRVGPGDVTLTLITPEDTPMAIFQGAGSAAVAKLLGRADVWPMTSAYVERHVGQRLEIAPGRRVVAADRVVALPALVGPAIDGLPSDPDGFVRADEYHRVPGGSGVYAIGDATTFPVKQGGIAAQHADLVASLIARTAGPEPTTRPRLRAILLTGEEPLYLQATITGGRSIASSASSHCPWWPPHKIAARHLAPYLADRAPVAPAQAASSGGPVT